LINCNGIKLIGWCESRDGSADQSEWNAI